MHKLPSLSVFFPCYNEVDNIGPLVEKTLGVVPELTDKFELIIVDDGSTDGTRQLSDRLADEHASVRAVHHGANRGYGAALQTGFDACRFDYIFLTDGDAQFDVSEIRKLMALLDEVDMALGFRMNRADPFIRSVNTFAYCTMIRLLFGLNVRDIDCAFKLLPREVIDSVQLRSTGALVSAELLLKARRAGFTFKQVGVSHYPRRAGQQSGANPGVVFRMFKELWQLRGELRGK